jgi:hypothetical protein
MAMSHRSCCCAQSPGKEVAAADIAQLVPLAKQSKADPSTS